MTSARMGGELEFRGDHLLDSLAVPPRIVAALKKGSSAEEYKILHNRFRLINSGFGTYSLRTDPFCQRLGQENGTFEARN